MRYPILFAAMILCAAPLAHAQDIPDAQIYVKAAMTHCLPAVKSGSDPAALAQKNLVAFPPDQAIKFAPDGGAVFMIPEAAGYGVMTTSQNYKGVCSIAIRETSAPDLWKAIDAALDSKSGWSLMNEQRIEQDRTTKKQFYADFNGPMAILVTVSDIPRKNAMQALITVARVKK